MKINLHESNRRSVHIFLAVAGTAGIAGLFLPFTMDVSPSKALIDMDLWQIVVPFLLSVFIAIGSMRRIFGVSVTKVEEVIAYFVGVAAAGVTLSIYFLDDWWSRDFQGILARAIPLVVLFSGTYLLFRNSKNQVTKKTNPLIAMQVPYLANCLMCLVMFWPNGDEFFSGGWQIGAYFCLATSIVYLVQIALFLTQKNEIDGPPFASVL